MVTRRSLGPHRPGLFCCVVVKVPKPPQNIANSAICTRLHPATSGNPERRYPQNGEYRCDICYLPQPCSLLWRWLSPRLPKMSVVLAPGLAPGLALGLALEWVVLQALAVELEEA